MGSFTPIGKRYTDIMVQKYYLQHLLFHTTSNAKVINHLTHIIIELQVLAHTLQTTTQVHTCVYNLYYSYVVMY